MDHRFVLVVGNDGELVIHATRPQQLEPSPPSGRKRRSGRRRPATGIRAISIRRSRRSQTTLYERAVSASDWPYRCTPARSAPATKISELRASACDTSSPPYESPQMPRRAHPHRAATGDIGPGDVRPGTPSSPGLGVRRHPERASVTDSAAIVDRHHDVTLIGEPLVECVRPVIELQVVVAPGASVCSGRSCTKIIAGRFSPGFRSFGRKSWL